MSFFGHGSSHAENRATHDTPQGTFHHPDIPVPEFGGINVWTAASDGDLARVEIFIQSGQHRADEPDEQGYTCIHAAASYGHHDMLRMLLDNPAVDASCKDEDGDTPLHVVEDIESAKILLDKGADPSCVNSAGLSPADNALAEERNAVAAFLRSRDPLAGTRDASELINKLRAGERAGGEIDLPLSDIAAACGTDGVFCSPACGPLDADDGGGKKRRT